MKFCCECGQRLTRAERPSHQHPVYHCANCECDYRDHPKLLVACFITCGDKLLWMKRALPPQKGHWAIPAGFMEQGENLRQAAARELWEETCVKVDPDQLNLYMMGTISFISEVYVAFHAEVDSTACCCGDESLDVGFFSRDELPWEEVAYPQANNSIEQAYADIARGKFGVYHAQMTAEVNELVEVPALLS